MIFGYVFRCSNCTEAGDLNPPTLWFNRLGFPRDAIIVEGVCFVCGMFERRQIPVDKIAEMMGDSDENVNEEEENE